MPNPTYTPAQLADEVQNLAESYRSTFVDFNNISDAIDYCNAGTEEYHSKVEGLEAEITEDNGLFEDISEAIQGKTGQTEPYEKDELANVISQEWPLTPTPVEEKYINFIDDDGTILYSWTEQELQEATELPPLPMEEGWIYQEWTWTLQEIKDNKFPMDVGVSRTPSNGASVRADCYFLETDNKDVYILFSAKNDIVDVDWGDGTVDAYTFDSQSYLRVTANHTYAKAGKYTIYLTLRNKTGKISYFSPDMQSENNNILGARITLIGLGNNYEMIGSYNFYGMTSLKRLSFANDSIVFNSATDWINSCYSLKCVCFPRTISPTSYPRTFYNTQGIEHIILPPNAKTGAGQFITFGTSIKRFNVPRSMNVLPIFTQSFGLVYIYIPKSITKIQSYSFAVIRKLQFVDLSDYDDPTKIPILDNVNAFDQTNPNVKLYVRNQSMLDAFAGATNWSTFAAQFVIGGKFAEVTT